MGGYRKKVERGKCTKNIVKRKKYNNFTFLYIFPPLQYRKNEYHLHLWFEQTFLKKAFYIIKAAHVPSEKVVATIVECKKVENIIQKTNPDFKIIYLPVTIY
ncbi:von Willebrand factor A domain-containing protein 8 [Platysternon megacephalum]|uniref:von Willebrand factor A domain-containing protein 8 n=1 Tax=Platysternon megacephalum TaxID=55544 RepID=A0A4D9F6P7_9SAUR|nr:von Willebrand factor A domain-containing protein 8 [Platysternon megacephalum]